MNPNDTKKLTRSEQSRINGAKSQGPATSDGKATSSRNAIKHGFAAKQNVVIASEESTGWQAHLDGYRASFNPTCVVESDLVDHIASIAWRQSRLVALETSLIDAQLCLQVGKVLDLHPASATDDYFHTALAWQALARQPIRPPAASPNEPNTNQDPTTPPDSFDINSIELVRRYQVSLDRQYRNTLLNLRQYRKDFAPPAAQVPAQAAPEPAPPLPPVPAPEAPITPPMPPQTERTQPESPSICRQPNEPSGQPNRSFDQVQLEPATSDLPKAA